MLGIRHMPKTSKGDELFGKIQMINERISVNVGCKKPYEDNSQNQNHRQKEKACKPSQIAKV